MSDSDLPRDALPTALERVENVEKRSDETLKEFVERVGVEADVDPEVLDDALEYIMEWHYSEVPPEDDEQFEEFLEQLRPGSASDEATADSVDGETDPGPVGIRSVSAVESDGEVGLRSGLRGAEPRMLLIRFVGVLLTAPVLALSMSRTWVPETQPYQVGQRLLSQILGLPTIEALEFAGMFGLGVYGALLFLFTLDVKKRVQGMLLGLGSVLALGVLWTQGIFLADIEPTTLNAVGTTVGFAAGLLIEGTELWALDIGESTLRRPARSDGSVLEFRAASLVLFSLLSLVVLVTLVAAVVAGEVQPLDVVAGGVFLWLLFQFVQYESETSYVTLGPERSGKSMMTLGLCQELLDNSQHDPRPNSYLRDGLERTSNLSADDERWPIPSTSRDEVNVGSFEVIAGSIFPRRLEVRAMDYAGQHLGRIAELFAEDEYDSDAEAVPQVVAGEIRAADTLLFLLDVERLIYPEEFQAVGAEGDQDISWGLEDYGTILESVTPDDTIVVATKCDILVDRGLVDPPSEYDAFDEFRDAVTEHLTSRPDVDHLLQLTGESTVHPVEFATRKRDGQYLPYLDDNGNLVPVGYDRLIDELRRRQ